MNWELIKHKICRLLATAAILLGGTMLSAAASGRYRSQGGVAADTPLTNIDAVIELGCKGGYIFKAASLDELASAIGGEMSAESLKASVAGYKPDGDAFGKPAEKFARLEIGRAHV